MKHLLVAIFLFTGHPIVKNDIENKLVKDEKVLPNGTVVGKYTYADPEGNPIHVKYYADDSSYGVELKSVKVVGAAATPATLNRLTSIENILQQSTDTPLGISSDFYNPTNIKYKTSDPFEIAKDKANTPYKNDYKISSDYEIYLQNELKAPKNCGKDKVHIYLDKEKRKIRDVSDSYLEAEKIRQFLSDRGFQEQYLQSYHHLTSDMMKAKCYSVVDKKTPILFYNDKASD